MKPRCGEHAAGIRIVKAGIFKLSDGREDLGRMPVGHGKCRGAPLASEAVESQGPGTLRAIGAIGLMSGTSMDGIDVAMLVTDGESELERGRSLFIPYDAAFRRRLAAALEPARAIRRREERPGGLDTLEAEITNRHADAVRAFLAAAPAGGSA